MARVLEKRLLEREREGTGDRHSAILTGVDAARQLGSPGMGAGGECKQRGVTEVESSCVCAA
jgi:hypothetical protein